MGAQLVMTLASVGIRPSLTFAGQPVRSTSLSGAGLAATVVAAGWGAVVGAAVGAASEPQATAAMANSSAEAIQTRGFRMSSGIPVISFCLLVIQLG